MFPGQRNPGGPARATAVVCQTARPRSNPLRALRLCARDRASATITRVADIRALWDFDDPVGSEQRFRAAAAAADGPERAVLLTQVARALGLQERYADGHALLDDLTDPSDKPGRLQAHVDLERGRLLRSAGQGDQARQYFADAARLAAEAGDEALEVDALHMSALLETVPADAVRANREALDRARASSDPEARRWEASLLNNLGCALVDDGRLDEALDVFETAVPLREARDERRETQIARWMVAWTLRLMGRTDEALTMQRALKTELGAEGVEDEYVDEELALLEQQAT